jgi:peptidoglycan/xylan/chitin deacetylase (PgdA/CDA1 family)
VVALTFDAGANADAVPSILATLRREGVPGEIVLMHVGSNPDDHTTFDADALAQVIGGLRAGGYSFVTLDALTG